MSPENVVGLCIQTPELELFLACIRLASPLPLAAPACTGEAFAAGERPWLDPVTR
jgi:hypothetical protein